MDDRFIRQQGIIPAHKLREQPFTVIGVGAVGSFVALNLAKAGADDITIWDHDDVEDHNIPNQWYRESDLGTKKVHALAEIVKAFTGTEIKTKAMKYTRGNISGVVICCVDSMDTRIRIWDQVQKQQPALYIDSRMGAEIGKVYVVNPASPSSCEAYEENMYPSSEAHQAPCTEKATMYCASGLASWVSASVSGYVRGIRSKSIIIDFRNMQILPG